MRRLHWIISGARCKHAPASIQDAVSPMPFPDLVHPALGAYESAVTLPAGVHVLSLAQENIIDGKLETIELAR